MPPKLPDVHLFSAWFVNPSGLLWLVENECRLPVLPALCRRRIDEYGGCHIVDNFAASAAGSCRCDRSTNAAIHGTSGDVHNGGSAAKRRIPCKTHRLHSPIGSGTKSPAACDPTLLAEPAATPVKTWNDCLLSIPAAYQLPQPEEVEEKSFQLPPLRSSRKNVHRSGTVGLPRDAP